MAPPSSGARDRAGRCWQCSQPFDLARLRSARWRSISSPRPGASPIADRDRYLADPRFRAGAGRRAARPALSRPAPRLIDPDRALRPRDRRATPPTRRQGAYRRRRHAPRAAGTSHISIVDDDGDARRHDHHHRARLRLAADGARLPAQQRAHRFFLRARR